MTRTYKVGKPLPSETIITEHTLSLTYEELGLSDWEKDIIGSFTSIPGGLTEEDVLVYIEFCTHIGAYRGKNRFGLDISRLPKESQDYQKKQLREYFRSAESHKRMKLAPFGGL